MLDTMKLDRNIRAHTRRQSKSKASASKNKGRHRSGCFKQEWVEPLRVTIPIDPRPKGRPRSAASIDTATIRSVLQNHPNDPEGAARAIKQRLKKTHHTPQATREFENKIALVAQSKMAGRAPLSCPVALSFLFVIKGDALDWPTAVSDPDQDNIEKAVKDALNGIVYVDDRLVCQVAKRKVCGPEPSVTFEVAPATIYVAADSLTSNTA